MQFDIQATIEENIRTKKALQMSRFQSQKLQKQLKQLRDLYQQQITKNKTLKSQYCQLSRKYQQSYTQSIKDNNALISQIQDLKKIIDDKQRDIQTLQIKLIPTLDQDMLRVKLITQMQGPYQQTVERKDKQIQKLKTKITQLERNLQITTLSMKSKIHEYKKQNQELKSRHQQETNRLMQELNLALSRNEAQSVQGSIIKNQRKQIQQLKTTITFVQDNEEKHINEIKELKIERKSLLEKLMILNTKQALLLQGEHNLREIQKLKEERIKNIKEIQTLKIQQQRLNRNIRKIEQQKTKIISQHQKQLNTERNNFLTEKNHINNEIYTLKQEIKRLKNSLISDESDKQANYEKVKYLQQQLYQKTKEVQTLRLQNSRISYKGTEPGLWQGFYGASKRQTFKQKETDQRQKQHERQREKQNEKATFNKMKKQQSKQVDKLQKLINELKKQNEKLKKKLAEANDKIMELIREKLRTGKNQSPQRDRTKSSIDRPMGVFLEYEDCGFKPLVEPTLYTYQNTSRM